VGEMYFPLILISINKSYKKKNSINKQRAQGYRIYETFNIVPKSIIAPKINMDKEGSSPSKLTKVGITSSK
jgi:hypothetical protein